MQHDLCYAADLPYYLCKRTRITVLVALRSTYEASIHNQHLITRSSLDTSRRASRRRSFRYPKTPSDGFSLDEDLSFPIAFDSVFVEFIRRWLRSKMP